MLIQIELCLNSYNSKLIIQVVFLKLVQFSYPHVGIMWIAPWKLRSMGIYS